MAWAVRPASITASDRPPSPSAVAAAVPAGAAQPSRSPLSDTCLTRHSDKGESLKGTKHGDAANPPTPAAIHGCESCHGPGQAHVDDDAKGHITKVGQMQASHISGTCLACHNRGNHAAWEGSAHDRRN